VDELSLGGAIIEGNSPAHKLAEPFRMMQA